MKLAICTQPLFYALLLAPCQCTQFGANAHFRFNALCWLCSTTLTLTYSIIPYWNIILIYAFLVYAHIFRNITAT